MTELPKIISVDDHVVEPAHVWQNWLPAKHKERGPRIIRERFGKMTLINGAKIKEPQPLRPGEILRVGNTHMKLEAHEPGSDTEVEEVEDFKEVFINPKITSEEGDGG